MLELSVLKLWHLLLSTYLKEKIEYQREVQMCAGNVGTQIHTVLKTIPHLMPNRALCWGGVICYNYSCTIKLFLYFT